jgi:hypothetical protein
MLDYAQDNNRHQQKSNDEPSDDRACGGCDGRSGQNEDVVISTDSSLRMLVEILLLSARTEEQKPGLVDAAWE